MLVVIDPTAAVPVFQQIAASIAAQVAGGVIEQGARLPAARELASALDVNVHTVLRAYQQLREEGLVELRRGRGAIVTRGPAGEPLAQAVRDAVAAAREAGLALPTLISLIRKEYEA